MTELKILDAPVYSIKDKVYFIMASNDNPTGFVLCYGEIIDKDARNLNVVYSIKLLNIISSKQSIIHNFHYLNFSVMFEKSSIFRKVKINVMDIVDDLMFETKLQEKTSKYLFPVQNFMCHRNLDKAKEIFESTKQICKAEIQNMLNKIEQA